MWCNVSRIRSSQTGECVPFWYSLFIFSQAYGQWLMHPVVIHQSATLTKDFVYDLPGYCIVHATPSGYMDRDKWPKDTRHFRDPLGATTWNHQVIFFDEHESHYDSESFDIMIYKFIQTFILKAGDSKNDHPNENGSNVVIKWVYNQKIISGEKGLWQKSFTSTYEHSSCGNKEGV